MTQADGIALFRGEEPVSIARKLADGAGALGNRLAIPAAVEMLPGKRESREQR